MEMIALLKMTHFFFFNTDKKMGGKKRCVLYALLLSVFQCKRPFMSGITTADRLSGHLNTGSRGGMIMDANDASVSQCLEESEIVDSVFVN